MIDVSTSRAPACYDTDHARPCHPRHRRRRLHRQPRRAPAGRARRARRGPRQSRHRLPQRGPGRAPRRWRHGRPGPRRPGAAAARHRHGAAFRRAHDRAGVGRESAEVLRQQHLRDAQPARAMRSCGREARGLFVDRGGLRHSGGRARARGVADDPDQPVRALEADERVDAARSRGRLAAALRGPALFQRRGQRPGRAHRAHGAGRHAARESGVPAGGRRPAAGVGVRHGLPDAGRHRGARLHPRRGSRCGAPARGRLPGGGRRVRDAQLRVWPRLQRPGSAAHGREGKRQAARRRGRTRGEPATRRRSSRMPQLVRSVLGWQPRFDDLETIVRTQLGWERRLLREPALLEN